jgi:non-ribosomal peptide synthase protein (TIGR01720 family)
VQVLEVPGGDEEVLGGLVTEVQAGLDLADGPVVRVVLLDRGVRGQLVVMVAHHLVVDAVSWPVLVADLSAAYDQVAAGAEVVLPAKTAAYGAWTARLAELAASAELAAEAGYWQEVLGQVRPVPADLAGANTVGSSARVRARLGAEATGRLLREVPAAFRTQVNDVLLTALGRVLGPWAGGPVVVDLESHGRHDVGLDVSRTVGWFTCVYPVPLGTGLKEMKEYLRAVPRGGLGYGLLRHLARALDGPAPQVTFNYLSQQGPTTTGQQQRESGPPAKFRSRTGTLGRQYSLLGDRTRLIEITAWVAGGRLVTSWTYGEAVHHRATIAALADGFIRELEDLIEYCCQSGASGLTPSDFPLAGLDQTALEAIRQRFGTAGKPTQTADPGSAS